MAGPIESIKDLIQEDVFMAKTCAVIAGVFFLFSWLGGPDLDPARIGMIGAGIFALVSFLYACQGARFTHQLRELERKQDQHA